MSERSILLEDIRHELVSLTGLQAFDDANLTDIEDVETFKLDYSNLIERIDVEIDAADTSVDAFVLDNCIEWYNLISELSKKEKQLYLKKEEYNQREFEIVFQSDIDFKALYGSTAEKVRKQHAKTELKELDKEIKGLELSVDYLKRRLSYLKGLVTVKTALLDAKKGE
jgi:hypothetical protein